MIYILNTHFIFYIIWKIKEYKLPIHNAVVKHFFKRLDKR